MYFRRIQHLRVDNDYKQEYIAKYLTMDRGVYGRYERGEREIPAWALIKLSELYNVSVDYLLDLTDNPSRNA